MFGGQFALPGPARGRSYSLGAAGIGRGGVRAYGESVWAERASWAGRNGPNLRCPKEASSRRTERWWRLELRFPVRRTRSALFLLFFVFTFGLSAGFQKT